MTVEYDIRNTARLFFGMICIASRLINRIHFIHRSYLKKQANYATMFYHAFLLTFFHVWVLRHFHSFHVRQIYLFSYWNLVKVKHMSLCYSILISCCLYPNVYIVHIYFRLMLKLLVNTFWNFSLTKKDDY